jgi:hypothetical protein
LTVRLLDGQAVTPDAAGVVTIAGVIILAAPQNPQTSKDIQMTNNNEATEVVLARPPRSMARTAEFWPTHRGKARRRNYRQRLRARLGKRAG